MASDGYLNLKEASKYLGVSDTKIRRLVDKGLLKISVDPLDDRKRLVKKNDLDSLKMPRPVDDKATPRQHNAKKQVTPKKNQSDAGKGNNSNEL